MVRTVRSGGDLPDVEPVLDLLELITSGSADGITIQDADGALVYANDAAARMAGFASAEEMSAAMTSEILERFEILDEDGHPLPVDSLPGRRALRGEQEPEAVIRFRRRPGTDERWALVHATPVIGAEGSVRHVVNVFVDISLDRKRRLAQAFLTDASRELWGSLDYEETLQRVARLAVPSFADWCSVDIVEPDGSLSLIALAHVDPEKVNWARELRRRFPVSPDDPGGVANVVRTGLPELIPEITEEMIAAAAEEDPELLDVIRRLQLSSAMTVPLAARGRILGALTMVWAESGNHYTEDDLQVGQELATRAAYAIDNARLYQERDHIARSLQERLLPRALPDVPGFEIAARYLPASDAMQAGGDFYDLFEMDDGSWKAVIGDVCGKGPEAAALMGFVRFTMRAVSRQDRRPSEALVKVNRALLEELDPGSGEFCTAAVVRVHPGEGSARLTIASAGHPLPLVIKGNGTVEELGSPGSLLGVFDDPDVVDVAADLEPGDVIVMVTDGVWEASREDGWEESVRDLLSSTVGEHPRQIADRIEAAVLTVDERRLDDVAILILKYLG